MKTLISAIVCAAGLAALSAAHAQGYVGGSLGSTRYKDDVGGVATDRNDTGGKIYGGYSFTPNVGVELGYADLGHATSPAGSIREHGGFLDLVGTLPVGQGFSVLGRVGAFYGRSRVNGLGSNESGTDGKYGLGVQYDFNKQVGLRGEWERYRFKAFGNKTDSDLYSIGVNYKF